MITRNFILYFVPGKHCCKINNINNPYVRIKNNSFKPFKDNNYL